MWFGFSMIVWYFINSYFYCVCYSSKFGVFFLIGAPFKCFKCDIFLGHLNLVPISCWQSIMVPLTSMSSPFLF